MKKKDYRNLIILEAIAIVMILLLTRGEFVFGSKVDWAYQHFNFPDYFRKLFYSTGNLFPNFAFHLGNGQNIFYFSYYGLYSPIFLLSYLFPFVNMGTFIQQVMAVLVILCTLFYYKWIRRRFNSMISFITSLLFLTATPLLFHASRHVMFISYMPFILLGLYGVDAYFKDNSKKSKIMLAFSVLGIILSNYFFSIVGIFTIFLYGLFVYLEKDNGNGLVHCYFKGNNSKMVVQSDSSVYINLESGKKYMINRDKKVMFITESPNLIKKGIQDDVLYIEKPNKDDAYKDKFRYEFVYIRDEKIDNKDCIFVKEREYNLETKEYNDVSYNSKNDVPTYWIEKSTGFVIGAALMEAGKDTATPQTMVTNIKLGEVTDDMFNDMLELPNDYKVFEVVDGNPVEINDSIGI